MPQQRSGCSTWARASDRKVAISTSSAADKRSADFIEIGQLYPVFYRPDLVGLALRDTLFELGEDISSEDVLVEIGRRFDVEPPDADAVESAVLTDWDRGKRRSVQGSPHFFIGDRGWFCPSLDISHEGGRFDVRLAEETMRDFYAAAFEAKDVDE